MPELKQKKSPLRKCIGCNEMKDKKQLIRIVYNKEGEMKTDSTGKLPGRGAYICKSVSCFDMALKAKRLEKAFKTKIPEDVYTSLREAISQE